MVSLVRETTHRLITLENPFPHPIEIKKDIINVESDVVYVSPSSFKIPAKSVISFAIFRNSDLS